MATSTFDRDREDNISTINRPDLDHLKEENPPRGTKSRNEAPKSKHQTRESRENLKKNQILPLEGANISKERG
jgi:hypothetical protein